MEFFNAENENGKSQMQIKVSYITFLQNVWKVFGRLWPFADRLYFELVHMKIRITEQHSMKEFQQILLKSSEDELFKPGCTTNCLRIRIL